MVPARQQRRRRREGRAEVNLPNDINAPAARMNYYKLFLEFMNYIAGNDGAYEYGWLFSE